MASWPMVVSLACMVDSPLVVSWMVSNFSAKKYRQKCRSKRMRRSIRRIPLRHRLFHPTSPLFAFFPLYGIGELDARIFFKVDVKKRKIFLGPLAFWTDFWIQDVIFCQSPQAVFFVFCSRLSRSPSAKWIFLYFVKVCPLSKWRESCKKKREFCVSQFYPSLF